MKAAPSLYTPHIETDPGMFIHKSIVSFTNTAFKCDCCAYLSTVDICWGGYKDTQ